MKCCSLLWKRPIQIKSQNPSNLTKGSYHLIPKILLLYIVSGVLYAKIGDLDDAIKSFEKSDKSYPNHGPTLANLAALVENQDPVKASEYAN